MGQKNYKILYLGIPYYSHVFPSLSIIKQLIEEGNQIIFHGIGNLNSEFEAAGAKAIPSSGHDFQVNVETIRNPLLLVENLLKANKALVPYLSKIIEKEKPDAIIHDHFCLWGKILAKKYQLPAISLVTTFALTPRVLIKYLSALPYGIKISLSDLLKIPKILTDPAARQITDLLINEEPLTIVFTSKYFQPLGGAFKPNYKFIGPSIGFRKEQNLPKLNNPNRETIYLCFGTAHGQFNLYKTCLDILKNSPCQIIASVGNSLNISEFGTYPKNITIRNFVPQLEILKQTAVFISHGGMNSVSESLYFGVPLVIIPLINEQVINATRIQELGAGICLKKEKITRKSLLAAIDKVLNQRSFRENTRKIRESFIAAGGYQRGTKEIIDYLNRDKI